MNVSQTIMGGLLGAVPGLVLLGLSWPVEPDLDLLLGVAGLVVALVGAAIGARASAEPDPATQRRVVLGATAGALLGLGFFIVQPVVGVVLGLVGAFAGANMGARGASGGRFIKPSRS